MKKVNIKYAMLLAAMLVIICVLKKFLINSLEYNTYYDYINILLVYWEDSVTNIIWLLPIILGMYIVSRKYYIKIQQFDMRYVNRRRFINKTLIKMYIFAIFVNLIIALFQIIVLSIWSDISIILNYSIMVLIIRYAIEMVFIEALVLLCSLCINSYMYAVIIFLILIILSLTAIINLSIIDGSVYIPFLNMYYSTELNVVTIFSILVVTLLIRKVYMKYDIIGGVD